MSARGSIALVFLPLLAACEATSTKFDYGKYLDHMPVSILVLPPLDQSPEVDAPAAYLSTVTQPLAERGYYVFPVAMVDAMMRENGLPTAGEMHQVSLTKIDEIFGADAVLYLTIKEWGTSYQVIDSSTTVAIEGRLIDVKSGEELWVGAESSSQSASDSGQNGLAGMLVGALVNQLVTSASDPSRPLAMQANTTLFGDVNDGLLLGRYHPEHSKDQESRRMERAKSAP